MSLFEPNYIKARFNLQTDIIKSSDLTEIINKILELIQTITSRFKLDDDIETYYKLISAIAEELDFEVQHAVNLFNSCIAENSKNTYFNCCIDAVLETFRRKMTRRLFLRLTRKTKEIDTKKVMSKLEYLNKNSNQELMKLLNIEILKEISRIICVPLNAQVETESLEKNVLRRLETEIGT
ncbi:MAG: hypothetical protein ACTSR2_09525 [Candidatus Hodarchaeales archaeon]